MVPSKRWLGIGGVLAVVAPRLVLALHAKVNLLGFQNTEDVKPSAWLVRVTQIVGLAALCFALLGPDVTSSTGRNGDADERIDFV